ncbi:hypothetical protein RMCBS344292_05806 [Rhizopus microsporus]|uniref:SH3 domain-containing protein n=1 Tax=Rhizopus microsporus TaxID=58291 RepID=A0A0A1N3T9_RHIZD|nr:hypothetical protein BCV71DRAFT_8110 [Rhizopus microsporus]CEI91520.1 hypothetical protein RMCBS344292_05806 [Rhizopus microsporus]
MNNYDKSKWLVMAGIITTTNAMWLPQKRGPEFHNAGDSESTDHSNKTTKDATQTTDKPKATHTTAKNEPTNNSSHTTAATHRSSSSPKTSSAASASPSSNSSNSKSSSSSSSSSSAPTSGAVSSTAIVSSPAPTVMSSSTSVPSLTGSISSSTPSASVAASTGSSGSSSSGAIIGAVVAVLVVAIAGAGALLFVRRRRRRQLKQSRAARMSTMNPSFGVENKPYDHQDNYSAPQTGYSEAPSMQQIATATTATSNFNTYQPALAINNQSKETIQQQQQQYYQTQSPTAVQPQMTEGPQEPQTASLGTFTVIATYIPTLSDELEIEPGDRIELLVEYDDGWCQGINITKNYAKGVFPRHCIDVVDQVAPLPPSSTTDVERTKRVSSMYVTGTSAK